MQFKDSKVVLFHGVVDLRKGAAGLVALVDDPEPEAEQKVLPGYKIEALFIFGFSSFRSRVKDDMGGVARREKSLN